VSQQGKNPLGIQVDVSNFEDKIGRRGIAASEGHAGDYDHRDYWSKEEEQ
jgi:hypothetical protein